MSQVKPDLTIIILNYNTLSWMKKVLSSLKEFHLASTNYETKVVVVDNHSSDDSVKEIKKNFPWVKIFESAKNLGFAGGNNLALKHVSTKYVMLLNSDTELTKTSQLDQLVEYLDKHQDVAVITPRLVLSNGKLDLASHRGEPTLWASFTYLSRLEHFFPHLAVFAQYHQTFKDLSERHEIDACSGAAMMVRTSAMHTVGLLDEQFFMYGEDLDWCKRFRDAGFKIIYNPISTIIHHKYVSGRSNLDQQVAKKTNHHFYQTMLQYYDKHYSHRYPKIVRNAVESIIKYKQGAL